MTVTVCIGGVAVIVIVTGGGQVELKTLELGLDEVDGVAVVVVVVTTWAELDVEEATLVVDVGDGEVEVVVVVVNHVLVPV